MSHSCSTEGFIQAISCCMKIKSVLASIGDAAVPGTKITIMIPEDVLDDIKALRKQLVPEYPFLKKDSSIVLFPHADSAAKDGNRSFGVYFDVPFGEFKKDPKPVEPEKFDISALFIRKE